MWALKQHSANTEKWAVSENSRSESIGTISPNSASLAVTKALSLRLLPAIDLDRPSLFMETLVCPSVLNARLSYLSPSLPSCVCPPACLALPRLFSPHAY